MSATPLLDRINARKPREEPQPIADRSGPFARRLLRKQLPPKEFYNGAVVPDGDRGAA